MHEEFENTQM